jgi:CheY-like chemotaxis protein
MDQPKILVVDDSMTACLFMSNILQQAGYQVNIARDGQEAFFHLQAQRPQCLILDVIMPGVNGYTVCRQVRAADPKHTMPIILVSTKNTPLDHTYGLNLGADRYLSKPFTGEALLQAVWEVLPPRTRFHINPPASPAAKPPANPLENLIPRHRADPALFATDNPFAGMERRTRLLYTAIDGRRTVGELCLVMSYPANETIRMLQSLFAQQRIEFRDREGRVVNPRF